VQIAAQHSEAVGKRAGISVKKGLLFDGIALHSGGVSPRHVESAATIEADFADAGLSFGNGTAVAAGKAAHAIIAEILGERGIGFADSLVENVTQGGHRKPLVYILTRRVGMAAEGFDFELSGCGLRVGMMGLHPADRICLNSSGLGTGESRSN
jgi:hypothetical protein